MTPKAKKIVSMTAVGSEVEKRLSLMNIIGTRMRESPTGDHISNLTVINLSG